MLLWFVKIPGHISEEIKEIREKLQLNNERKTMITFLRCCIRQHVVYAVDLASKRDGHGSNG